jgi:hypothetical protein
MRWAWKDGCQISGELGTDGVRETALDALHAAFDGLAFGGREEQVKVFGHNDEGVKPVTGLVAISEEVLK